MGKGKQLARKPVKLGSMNCAKMCSLVLRVH